MYSFCRRLQNESTTRCSGFCSCARCGRCLAYRPRMGNRHSSGGRSSWSRPSGAKRIVSFAMTLEWWEIIDHPRRRLETGVGEAATANGAGCPRGRTLQELSAGAGMLLGGKTRADKNERVVGTIRKRT